MFVVTNAKNLADPEFEPSDEDLLGLAKRAFAHIRQQQETASRKLHVDIANARRAALERLRRRLTDAKAAG